MARISSLPTLAASVALCITGCASRVAAPADPSPSYAAPAYVAPSYPAPSYPAPSSGSVYGGWTTPRPAGYGTWTTPRPPSYGTWATPPPGGYGTWTTPPGSARAYGTPSTPSIPESAAVVASAPSSGGCAPVDAACPCSPWRFGAFARYWRPTIRGHTLITLGGEPGSGTSADVHDDLGLDPADGYEAGASVSYGRHRVTLAYESDSFSGSSTLGRAVVFHGETFPAGADVESDLDLTFWKLGYDYALLDTFEPGTMGVARSSRTVRVGLSGWLWDYDGRVRSAMPALDTSRTFSHVLPVATISAAGSFDLLHGAVRASGGLLASDRYVIDLEVSAGVTLWDRLSLDVGYRWMNLAFHETTNEADLVLHGPFAGVSIEF